MPAKHPTDRARLRRIQRLCAQLNEAIEASAVQRHLLERLAKEAGEAAQALLERAPDIIDFKRDNTERKK